MRACVRACARACVRACYPFVISFCACMRLGNDDTTEEI